MSTLLTDRAFSLRAAPLLTGLLLASLTFAQGEAADHELFENKVRPLLDKRCGNCHGEDALGELRLDSRAAILAGGASGPAIVVGQPDQSLLIQAVRHELPKLEMPMTGGKLTAEQIADLSLWVERGAPWPGEIGPGETNSSGDASSTASLAALVSDEDRSFWSFQPIEKPAVPQVEDIAWIQTPIDNFIRRKLETNNLSPAPLASKNDLLRRLSFDLTGLPPTPAEIAQFLADDRQGAINDVIERLLASEHYGERWGRHWLDVARYGEDDTRGLAEDGTGRERYPNAFRYRDWVVKAINTDMSWPTFVKAQIAADLLPEEDRQELLPALGLLGAGPWYYDLAEPATARADERHDKVDVTTRGFLGLTVGCARCHNHKYDPIPTADYYSLAGLFSNSVYHEYPIGTQEQIESYEKDKEYRKVLKKSLGKYTSVEGDQLAIVLSYQISKYMMGAWKVAGEPKLKPETVAYQDKLDLELLQRYVAFLAKEPKNYQNLVDWQTMIAKGGDDKEQEKEAQKLADRFQREVLDVYEERRKLREQNEYIIANGSKPPRDRKSTPMPNGFESFFDQHQLELETMPRESMLLAQDVFDIDIDKTTDVYDPEPGLLRFWGWGLERQLSSRATEHLSAVRAQIEELDKPENQLPFVMGLKDLEPEQITDLGLHLRGSPNNLGAPVPRHFLTVLSPGEPERFSSGSGRLEFAEAVASHPLTARVIVNRVWRWHFGTGLVDTPSNFGKMGERPSHPELLEYLAARFLEEGQSLKWLHREILGSRTYQLSAQKIAANNKQDPDNRLYWRANRRRLGAEAIRDSLLATAGNLDRSIGGRSLELNDEKNLRRTLYSKVSRFQLDTYLQTFDFPNPSLTAERRFVTNVPLQNLYFMNSDFVKQQAEVLAKRLAKPRGVVAASPAEAKVGPSGGLGNEPGATVDLGAIGPPSDRERIERAYLLLYGRSVSEKELALGLAYLEEARKEGVSQTAEAENDGEVAKQEVDPAWVQYARALFNANEFRFLS